MRSKGSVEPNRPIKRWPLGDHEDSSTGPEVSATTPPVATSMTRPTIEAGSPAMLSQAAIRVPFGDQSGSWKSSPRLSSRRGEPVPSAFPTNGFQLHASGNASQMDGSTDCLATKAICWPSGDQSGWAALGRKGKSRTLSSRVVTSTMKTLLSPVDRVRPNTISLPVGDHDGSESDSPGPGEVTCSIPEPSEFATKIAVGPPGVVSPVKPRRVPSTDHTG